MRPDRCPDEWEDGAAKRLDADGLAALSFGYDGRVDCDGCTPYDLEGVRGDLCLR